MASDVLWRRMKYFLSPQLDIYQAFAKGLFDKTVLEVGFGTGIGAVQMAYYAKEIIAIEPDQDAVEFADEVFPLLNVCWLVGDICDYAQDPAGNPIDTVVMIEVLEHIPDWEKALQNVCRILPPGGALVISARNANADLRRNELHEREWTASEFVSHLKKYFRDVVLYDHTGTRILYEDTRQTPLIAWAIK